MSFGIDQFSKTIERLPDCSHYWIAFSGGLDSSVLLHAMCGLGVSWTDKITAVYVNHQLHHGSHEWALHCERFCQSLGVSFRLIQVQVVRQQQLGQEGAARAARYAALKQLLREREALMTAHHSDDQVETVLLQLFRGAGPAGLAAMPWQKPFGQGLHLRPLLGYTRAELKHYAQQEELQWIEDPSNQLLQHDRNYLRHRLLPDIRSRWPSVNQVINRATGWQSESLVLQQDLARIDIEVPGQERDDCLSVLRLNRLSNLRIRNALRYWIRNNGFTLPGVKVLDAIVRHVLQSRADARPVVSWDECEVRRYRNTLYIMSPLEAFDANQEIFWNTGSPLYLKELGITLKRDDLVKQLGYEPDISCVTVRFRTGGEKLSLRGRAGTRTLKKIWQENAVPPWQRSRIPLIYAQDRLILIWGIPLHLAPY